MRIGIGIMAGCTAAQAVDGVRQARDEGFACAWFSNIFGSEAMVASAIAGSAVEGIDVGTFVIPVYTRHPLTMAQQAITTQDACRGRFVLGVGLSHQVVIETMMGIPFVKPARTMREYLSVLMPLVTSGSVSFTGAVYTVNATLERPEAFTSPPVLVAALGPKMLEIAGSLADGTATWMTGQRTVEEYTIPTIHAAAREAGRAVPRVAMGLPVCVTSDPDEAKLRASRVFALYGSLPSYRAMLDREGAEGPAQVSLVGDAGEIADRLRSLSSAGVTDFVAAPFGTREEMQATRKMLVDLAGELS